MILLFHVLYRVPFFHQLDKKHILFTLIFFVLFHSLLFISLFSYHMINILELSNQESSIVPTLILFHLQEFIICYGFRSAIISVAKMTTSSFNNPPINLLNDYSSVYYGSFNRNSQNSQAKRWTKDDNHYNSKRCTHCGRRGHTIDKCHRLHSFSLNYKRRKFFVNNVTAIKKANESKTLTNQKNLNSLLTLI